MFNLTPQYPVLSFEEEVLMPEVTGSSMGDTIGGWAAGSGELSQGKMRLQSSSERILIGAATAPTTGTGIFMGNAGDDTYDFRVGNPSGNYLHWDESAGTLTLVGSLTATSGTIGGFDIGSDYIRDAADSFGLASTVSGSDDVRFWAGAAFASRASAPARIYESGAAVFSNVSITGGSVTGTPISSIPNDSSTDISLLEYTHNLAFSVTDNNTVAWGSGTITLSNGRTFSITASNTGNMAARTYIYLDPGTSSTALQTTTTASTAMGANKILIAVAENGSGQATYQVYGGIGGLKIGSAGINIANNNWTFSGTWSVTDLNTIAWGAGTLKTSDGTSYSISGSNTGNMAAKTYIYFDLGTSSTALQTTTTATTAIGDGKILIAIAQNGTNEANFIVMNDKSHNIDAANIVAGSISANEIAAGAVTATKISVSTLSAISADLGTITAGTVTGATIRTASSGTRFQMTSTAFQGINSAGAVIFEIILSGASAGDVIFGDDSTGNYAIWDNSASEFNVFANNITGAQNTTYTSGSGNWTKPTGCKLVLLRMWGGGGGGGGCSANTNYGGGGGGGGFAEFVIDADDLGSTVAYSVGSGGSGSSGQGSAGGNSTFGSYTAYGGGGGAGGDNAGSGFGGGGGGGSLAAGSTPGSTSGGAGGGPVGGSGGSGSTPPTDSSFGGGGGGSSTATNDANDGADSALGGGGGGGSASNSGIGGNSWKGGAGGGGQGGSTVGGGGAGGTSILGGNGGAGSGGSGNTGVAGTAPGGGGGGAGGASSVASGGSGGAGRIEISAIV